MPGIFGVIDFNKATADCDLSTRMRAILRHDPSYKDYAVSIDHCAMGASTPPYFNSISLPVHNEEKTLTLVMEGELFNSDPSTVGQNSPSCGWRPE